jgi:protein-S-isoprenylcysteine O-methyltransferase Ste14
MIKRRNWPSKLIVTAQFMVGLVALLGLAAFASLNPYLITIFAFFQVLIIVGVVLFIVALITSRGALAADAVTQNEDRLYVLKGGRQPLVRRHFKPHRELEGRGSRTPDVNRQER